MGFFNFFSSHKETQKQNQQSVEQLGMFANLSQTQKYAMVTMLASLAAAPTDAEKSAMAQKMVFSSAALMGITQNMMLDYMQTHGKSNSQTVISTLRTITDVKVKEWLIYAGFGIIAVNQNAKARYVFYDWWHQLGYEPEDVDQVVEKTEAICNKIRQFNNF